MQQPQRQQSPGGQNPESQQPSQGGSQQLATQQFHQSAPQPIQQLIRDLEEFEKLAEWAHTESMQQGHHQVGTITDHFAEIAHLQKKLVMGRSPFAQTFAQCTERSIQQGVQQLEQYSPSVGVQEVIKEAQYTSQSLGQAQRQLQQWSQTAQGGGMGQSRQMHQGGQTSQQAGSRQMGSPQSQQY